MAGPPHCRRDVSVQAASNQSDHDHVRLRRMVGPNAQPCRRIVNRRFKDLGVRNQLKRENQAWRLDRIVEQRRMWLRHHVQRSDRDLRRSFAVDFAGESDHGRSSPKRSFAIHVWTVLAVPIAYEQQSVRSLHRRASCFHASRRSPKANVHLVGPLRMIGPYSHPDLRIRPVVFEDGFAFRRGQDHFAKGDA